MNCLLCLKQLISSSKITLTKRINTGKLSEKLLQIWLKALHISLEILYTDYVKMTALIEFFNKPYVNRLEDVVENDLNYFRITSEKNADCWFNEDYHWLKALMSVLSWLFWVSLIYLLREVMDEVVYLCVELISNLLKAIWLKRTKLLSESILLIDLCISQILQQLLEILARWLDILRVLIVLSKLNISRLRILIWELLIYPNDLMDKQVDRVE